MWGVKKGNIVGTPQMNRGQERAETIEDNVHAKAARMSRPASKGKRRVGKKNHGIVCWGGGGGGGYVALVPQNRGRPRNVRI